jgi:predicted MPP superfamily phosphohydrolase
MKKRRKHYTPEEKVAILRRHLVEGVPISDLCDELGLQPTVFYRWQKEFFENGAPFGCLGNHEVITQTEESITRLFAAVGIRILRQERAPIRRGEEALNLIGVDDSLVDLQAIQSLVIPKTVNILLVHNLGNDFEAAVQFGFDLILMGHTHGGQLSLEFLRRGLSFARIETPYVSGWYEKSGGQLYVNRGIGTTIIPIRVGARPEITVLELVRGV